MPRQSHFQPMENLVAERLREARLSRGMTTGELAEKIGKSRQAVSKYELGSVEPPPAVLDAIALQLNFPLSFFYKPLEQPENRGTTFYRSLKTNAVHAKEILFVRSRWATQIASVLLQDVIFPPVDIPSLPEKYDSVTEYSLDDIEEITLYLRDCWKLGYSPISDMSKLLETHGIVIASIKTGFPETDACSAIVEQRPFVFLDIEKECAVRNRFNMAHELGHLMLHTDISQNDLEDKNLLGRIEREANQFASCFLLPREAFLLDIRSSSLQAFLPLKRKWKVSIQAMVYRCQDLHIFSESQMIYIQKQISAKRWRKNEPYDAEWVCEEASILRTAVKMLIDRGDYTKEQFVDVFRLSASDMEEICSLPKGYLSSHVHENAPIIDFATRKIIAQN